MHKTNIILALISTQTHNMLSVMGNPCWDFAFCSQSEEGLSCCQFTVSECDLTGDEF